MAGSGSLPLGRHLELALADGRPGPSGLLSGSTNDHGRPAVPPLEDRGPRVDPEPARLLGRAVALVALVDQDRPDPGLEEGRSLRPSPAPGSSEMASVPSPRARPATRMIAVDPGRPLDESRSE